MKMQTMNAHDGGDGGDGKIGGFGGVMLSSSSGSSGSGMRHQEVSYSGPRDGDDEYMDNDDEEEDDEDGIDDDDHDVNGDDEDEGYMDLLIDDNAASKALSLIGIKGAGDWNGLGSISEHSSTEWLSSGRRHH